MYYSFVSDFFSDNLSGSSSLYRSSIFRWRGLFKLIELIFAIAYIAIEYGIHWRLSFFGDDLRANQIEMR